MDEALNDKRSWRPWGTLFASSGTAGSALPMLEVVDAASDVGTIAGESGSLAPGPDS